MTKEEYRRLTEQVRDVDSFVKNRFCRKPIWASSCTNWGNNNSSSSNRSSINGSTHEKFSKPKPMVPPDTSSRTQVSSLFHLCGNDHPLKKVQCCYGVCRDFQLRPSVMQYKPTGPRPPSSRFPSTSPHLNTASQTLQRRPRSAQGFRPESRQPKNTRPATVTQNAHPSSRAALHSAPLQNGNFHALSSELISGSQLLKEARTNGPLCSSWGKSIGRGRGEKEGKGKDRKVTEVDDDYSTTSGVESDGGHDDDDDDDDDVDEDSEKDEDCLDDDSSDSENEGFEPSLDDVRHQLPRNLLCLRPEQLDARSYLEDKPRDPRQIEFDAKKNKQPVYQFKSPLPDYVQIIDLGRCVREKSNWRAFMKTSWQTVETPVRKMLDRLIQLEKKQMLTREREARKLRARCRRQEKAAMSNSNNSSGSRAASGRQREARLHLCSQPACCGDCSERRRAATATHCFKCNQPWCFGTCQEPAESSANTPPGARRQDVGDTGCLAAHLSSPSKACMSFQRRSDKVGQSPIQPTRPKSGLADFKRKSSSVNRQQQQQRDYLRPVSAALSTRLSSLSRDFERLAVDPLQPLSPNNVARPRTKSPYSGALVQGKTSKSKSNTTRVCLKGQRQ